MVKTWLVCVRPKGRRLQMKSTGKKFDVVMESRYVTLGRHKEWNQADVSTVAMLS